MVADPFGEVADSNDYQPDRREHSGGGDRAPLSEPDHDRPRQRPGDQRACGGSEQDPSELCGVEVQMVA